MSFSWLQWCAPELAREGLLTNAAWVECNCAEAVSMYGNQGLHVAATIMAALNDRAIDYLRQAPVLALAACRGTPLHRARERQYLAKRWSSVVAGGPKLRIVLSAYGLTLQHRAIQPGRLAPSYWKAVAALSSVPPSVLAQSIPVGNQAAWLRNLTSWRDTMLRRGRSEEHLWEWAVFAFGRRAGFVGGATDIADFAAAHGIVFDTRWTAEQANAAAARWHTELAKMEGEKQFYARHGIGFDELIDYGRLPVEWRIGDCDIVALQSGSALFEEGAAMHHCVASYTREVVTGASRIYSVRKDGKRLATFELTAPRWTLRQLKGPCNAPVGAEVTKAVSAFVKEAIL